MFNLHATIGEPDKKYATMVRKLDLDLPPIGTKVWLGHGQPTLEVIKIDLIADSEKGSYAIQTKPLLDLSDDKIESLVKDLQENGWMMVIHHNIETPQKLPSLGTS